VPSYPPTFTLVELLAVIVMISMVAGIATVGLAASSESARLHAAAAAWRDLDARARLFGRTLGPVVMTLSADRNDVRLHVQGSGELLSEVTFAGGVTGRILAEPAVDSVAIDRLGRSVDYDVELRSGDRIMTWRVLGTTGLLKEREP
jgi:type II secretory pathway pseudopilin PulG